MLALSSHRRALWSTQSLSNSHFIWISLSGPEKIMTSENGFLVASPEVFVRQSNANLVKVLFRLGLRLQCYIWCIIWALKAQQTHSISLSLSSRLSSIAFFDADKVYTVRSLALFNKYSKWFWVWHDALLDFNLAQQCLRCIFFASSTKHRSTIKTITTAIWNKHSEHKTQL